MRSTTHATRSPALLLALFMALALFGCEDNYSSDVCRLNPSECNGSAGTRCDREDDCLGGLFCCTTKNCGGGMCTGSCRDSGDCPPDMRCKHEICLYACSSDSDCAPGMSCEHDKTVCEYD